MLTPIQQRLQNSLPYTFNPQQQCLSLFNQHIESQGLKYIFEIYVNQPAGQAEGQGRRADIQVEKLKANNRLCWLGAACLGRCQFGELRELSLYRNNIGAKGVRELLKGQFPKLSQLTLGANNLPDSSLLPLSKSPLPCLQTLYISHNKLTNQSIYYLSQAYLPSLTTIMANDNQGIGEIGVLGVVGLRGARAGKGRLERVRIESQAIRRGFKEMLQGIDFGVVVESYLPNNN